MANEKRAYKLKAPKYFTKQWVEFVHHNGNVMTGVIDFVQTHYSYNNDEGYHIYSIHKEGNKRSVWIGENKILNLLR